jgi:hypothetical protein
VISRSAVRRTGVKRIATAASDVNFFVFGVNVWLHVEPLYGYCSEKEREFYIVRYIGATAIWALVNCGQQAIIAKPDGGGRK